MKKLLSILTVSMAFANATAQQITPYSSYYFQPVLLNPAHTGLEGPPEAFLLFRKQWTGIPNSPETQLLNIHGSVAENMGLGLQLMDDKQNIIGKTGGYLSYRYSIQLGENQRLSMGVSAGAFQNKVLFDRITTDAPDDELLLVQAESKIVPDASAGLLWELHDLKVGLGSFQVLGNSIHHENQATFQESRYRLIRHYIATAQYSFNFGNDWTLDPVLVARSAHGLDVRAEGGVYFSKGGHLWFGATYQHESNVRAHLGAYLFEKIGLAYTYEYPLTDIAQFTGGSHEVGLSYRFVKSEEIQNRKNHRLQKRLEDLREENLEQYERLETMQQEIGRLVEELKKAGEGTGTVDREEVEKLREELLKLLQEQAKTREQLPPGIESGEDFQDLKNSLKEKSGKASVEEGGTTGSVSGQPGPEEYKKSLAKLRNFEMEDPDANDYHLVIAAFGPISAAKEFQQMLERGYALQTSLLRSDSGTYYYVTSPAVNNISEAVDALYPLVDKNFPISGNPWVYVKGK